MSAQDRHKRQERAPKPAQRGPLSADPALSGSEPIQPLSLPNGRFSPSVGDALEDERKRLEEALRDSEERFRGLFEASPWGLLIHDEGRILDANPTLAMIFGYEVSELVGMDAPHLVAPEWRDFTLQKRLAGCEEPYEAVSLKRDGTTFPVQLCGKAVRSNGRVVRIVAVRDLAERKRAEEALREREERFRELVYSISDVFFAMDGDLNYTYWNKASEDLTGISAQDAIGKPLHDLFPEVEGTRAEEMYLEVLRTRQPRKFVNQYQLGGKDFFFEISAYPSGTGLSVFVKDITERKRAEEALRGSEERFRLISRVTSDVIWDWDLRTGRVWRSEGMQRLFGYAPSEEGPRVTWWYQRVHPQDRERANRGFYATISGGGESWFNEYRFRRADGSYAHVQERDYIIRDANGKPVRMIGGMTDITERKRAEEALRESEERFRLIAQATSDAIYDCDLVTGSVWWSEGMRTLFGYAPGDIGSGVAWWYEHIHPQDRDGVVGSTYAAIAGGEELWSDEYRLQRADLSYACVFDRGYFIYDRVGKPLRMIGGITDITERKQAEEALGQAEGRYRMLFDQAPAMYVITRNQDGVPIITDCNELLMTTLGYSRAELLGRPLADFYTPPSRAQLLEHGGYQRAIEGRFVAEERQLLTRSGDIVETVLRAVPEFDADGRSIGTRAMYLDITERRRAQQALEQSERRYRLLAENATDVIWTMDRNLRTTYISPSVVRLRGYSVEEAMAQTLEGVLTPASLDVATKVLAEELAVERRPEKDLSRSRTLELEHTCKDGSTVWAEVRMTALRGESGRLVGILGVSRDISERRRAQTSLEASEKRYRLLAENASDIIWIRDLDLGGIYVNPAVTRIRGYTPEEAMAQIPEEILAPASLELAREVLAEELAKEQVESRDLFWWRTLELENICKDGSTVWLEEKVTALRDEDKRIVGILGISRDISERRRAEEALQEAREELESRVELRMRRGSAYGLTFRELTVLHLVVAGKSDKEIASVLGISTLTASKHLANILHKMIAASRTEAGVRAVREGLLD